VNSVRKGRKRVNPCDPLSAGCFDAIPTAVLGDTKHHTNSTSDTLSLISSLCPPPVHRRDTHKTPHSLHPFPFPYHKMISICLYLVRYRWPGLAPTPPHPAVRHPHTPSAILRPSIILLPCLQCVLLFTDTTNHHSSPSANHFTLSAANMSFPLMVVVVIVVRCVSLRDVFVMNPSTVVKGAVAWVTLMSLPP